LTAKRRGDILRAVLNINEGLTDPGTVAPRARTGAETKEQLIREIQDSMAAARAGGMRQGFRNLMGRSVSMTHMHVLAKLRMAGALPMGRLAEALDVSVASATGIVGRMEERGLVERKRDASDRRVVMVELADGGTAALEEIEARGRDYMGRVLERLTRDELIQLRNGFLAMHRAGQEIARQETGPSEQARAGQGKGQPHE
jgi:DNA-binding MarR family transcriptional regulator